MLLILAVLGSPASVGAVANPDDTLTYEPYGLVHQIHPAAKVDSYLADLDSYHIGQAFLQTPRFRNTGVLRVPRSDRTMLARWSSRAAVYNATHGTHITVTAVFNGQVKTTAAGLDLDNPQTRASMIDGIRSVLTTGVSGVHLDLEPFLGFPPFGGHLDSGILVPWRGCLHVCKAQGQAEEEELCAGVSS